MHDLVFQLTPSKQYVTLLTSTLLTSALIILFFPFPIAIKGLGFLFVVSYGLTNLWHGLLRSQHSIMQVRHQGQGKWILYTRHKMYFARIHDSSTVTTKGCLLRFRLAEGIWPISCLIFPDSLPLSQYRLLLVTLKFTDALA